MNNSPFRNTLSNKVNVLCQKINHLSRNIDIHIENKNNLQYEEYFFLHHGQKHLLCQQKILKQILLE